MKAVIFLAVLVLSSMLLTPLRSSENYNVIDFKRACSFLEHQYVSEVGLLRASFRPEYSDYNKAYIGDNLLGYEALRVCGQGKLARKINETLNAQYRNYLYSIRWRVLLGVKIESVPRLNFYKVLKTVGNLTVMAEVKRKKPLTDWRDYADWLFLEAINSMIIGNKSKAYKLFKEGMELFDGSGFKDKAYNKTSTYDTYKLGLAVLAYKELSSPLEYKDKISEVLHVISRSQDPVSGGIFTNYRAAGNRTIFGENISDANVETTSLIILALKANLTELTQIPNHEGTDLWFLFQLILILFLVVFATLEALRLE